MRIKYALLFILIAIPILTLFSQSINAQGYGLEIFLHMDRTSAEVGQIISGKVTTRVYRPSSGERACVPRVIFGDGTDLVLGNCVAGPDTPHNFIECDFNFIHVYDSPRDYNLTIEGLVAAGMHFSEIDGPQRTITIAERATSSAATSIEPALAATSTAEIIRSVIRVVYWIVGSLLVLMIMIGGFTILTSAGNPNRVSKGKQIIVYAVIGFAIMAVSRGILELIYLILDINIP